MSKQKIYIQQRKKAQYPNYLILATRADANVLKRLIGAYGFNCEIHEKNGEIVFAYPADAASLLSNVLSRKK